EVEPIHFLAVALGLTEIVKLLEKADVDYKKMETFTETQLQGLPKTDEPSYLSGSMIDFLKRAEQLAGNQNVSLEHLMYALSDEKRGASVRILQAFGIGSGELKGLVAAKEAR